MTKMVTKGARKVNFKKEQHSALSIFVRNILNLLVRKSVVLQLQKTNFKKESPKKKLPKLIFFWMVH